MQQKAATQVYTSPVKSNYCTTLKTKLSLVQSISPEDAEPTHSVGRSEMRHQWIKDEDLDPD